MESSSDADEQSIRFARAASMPGTNPIVAGLPPALDYMSYLTVLEYHLSEDDLPLLHGFLQDPTLTTNIGWDLVELLLPMLPASRSCLDTIARLGNPREVILKVTEALRLMDRDFEAEIAHAKASYDNYASPEPGRTGSVVESASNDDIPERVKRFETLLSMLSVLHPRVKTKRPSRFIATSLQAVLACYANAPDSHLDALIACIPAFVHSISGGSRISVSSGVGQSSDANESTETPAADPEAQQETQSTEDKLLQWRLLQSLVSHLAELYMILLLHKSTADDDIPSLGWTSRLFEMYRPSMVVPGKMNGREAFSKSPILQARSAVLDSLDSLAHDLNLTSEDLLVGTYVPRKPYGYFRGVEADPPSSASDVPLSQTGSLLLLTKRIFSQILSDPKDINPDTSIFPVHAKLLRAFVGTDAFGGLSSAGTESNPVLDSILALGLVALENNAVGEPKDDEDFTSYLQITSLLSANTPSPSLRFHAHYLTSSVLRSHPSDMVRLSFIRDTLEHCPYENLKGSAVSWIKGEIMEANPPSTPSLDSDAPSIFTTPVALETLSPFLFPDITQALGSSDLLENWEVFKRNLSFYLATLNFYYFLLRATHLHKPLNIEALHTDNDIGGSMIGPLRSMSNKFRSSLDDGKLAEVEGEGGVEAALLDLELLGNVLDRVEEGVIELNKP